MDINTPLGSKVYVTEETLKFGMTDKSEELKKYVEIGKDYEVECIRVSGFHTEVWLKGVDYVFNSVNLLNTEDYESPEEKHEMFKRICKKRIIIEYGEDNYLVIGEGVDEELGDIAEVVQGIVKEYGKVKIITLTSEELEELLENAKGKVMLMEKFEELER